MPLHTKSGKLPVISVAPMIDVTDQNFRYLCRLLSKHTVLYTPMITDLSLIRDPHGPLKHLPYQQCEHPVVAQLGGSTSESMCQAAKLCEQHGYDEININCGCPAESARSHAYGAVLMRDPNVFTMIRDVCNSVKIPVTVKCRIGVYNTLGQCNQYSVEEKYEWFKQWIQQLITHTPVRTVIVHCRAAILNFRPEKNRTAPVLIHEFAYRIKTDFPHLNIHINGEINSIDDIKLHLSYGIDGCMIGRAAWKNPYMLSQIDELIYDAATFKHTRIDIIQQYVDYAEQQLQQQLQYRKTIPQWKPQLKNLLNPLIHICNGTYSSKQFRTTLSELNHPFRQYYVHNKNKHLPPYSIRQIVDQALAEVDDVSVFNSTEYVNVRADQIALNPQCKQYVSVKQHTPKQLSNSAASSTDELSDQSDDTNDTNTDDRQASAVQASC